MNNKNKIILDLCGGTGAWSKPYRDNGYSVLNVTLPDYNIFHWDTGSNSLFFSGGIKDEIRIDISRVYGILSAPPCTQFSFARTYAKKPRDLLEGMELVKNCLNIIWECQSRIKKDTQKYPPLKFWCLENPKAMLQWFLGKPVFEFHPYEFGDGYKKKTALWGCFNIPQKNPKLMSRKMKKLCKTNSRPLPKFDRLKTKEIHGEFYHIFDRQTRRSMTPSGFAKAFYEANR